MRQTLSALLTAAVSALCASAQGAAPAVPPVTLYTDFQLAAPEAVVEAMRAEVDSIMAPAGLRFEWRPLAEFRSDHASAALVVAHFEKRCDVSSLVMRQNRGGSLGWTEISDGTVLPFTHIDCDRVRTFLQTSLLGYHPEERERTYGRALGRVLAHELYHVFAVTSIHTARGIAKEDYSVKDLLAGSFPLHGDETRTLRSSKVTGAQRAVAGSF